MTMQNQPHPGDLTLRRLHAAEPLDESISGHVRTCTDCSRRLAAFNDEARAFQAEIPFERFAAGVEKAARVQRREPSQRGAVLAALVAVAAVLVGVVAVRWSAEGSTNRLKGGDAVEFVIDGPAGQRAARELEPLVAGDRLRIGVSGHRQVLAVSIDDAGEITGLYAQALPNKTKAWLPDSLEFTGAGREHVVVLLTDEPLPPSEVHQQLRERFRIAGGDLTKLDPLPFPGLQVHRTFLKP